MLRPTTFVLANSPVCRVLDRFSDVPHIEEDEDGRIPFWPLLSHLIQQHIATASHLIDVLQSVSAVACTESTSSLADDYGSLKTFLSRYESDGLFFQTTWPNIRDIALGLPEYFPSGELAVLQTNTALQLSRGQVACLVVHQFLCSAIPQREDEGYQDFSIWYSSAQRHPRAVEMYLAALFAYFRSLPDAKMLLEDHKEKGDHKNRLVTYELHQRDDTSLAGVGLRDVYMEYLDNHTTSSHEPEIQGPKGAVVVSANKIIGFGQSATQEEIFVGIAPEACPAVLFAPHLTNNTIITVSKARAMLSVTGQRRDIQWAVRPTPSSKLGFHSWLDGWSGGNLIFMDALEMDNAEPGEGLPDLRPENITREIHKAALGFSNFDKVWTGLWGCGAFCGNVRVKLVLLWLAASAAGVDLHVMLSPEQHDVGHRFETFMKECEGVSASELQKCLMRSPMDNGKLERYIFE